MPFTFAHPAIVLPIAKMPGKYLSLTALIIGSMIPDFEYFIRMKVFSMHSHQFSGLFYFDLPVGLLMYFVFVELVRVPLMIHLPTYVKERFNYSFREKNLMIVTGSIFIGALSHLFWDSFTHATGYMVQHIHLLRSEINIGHYTIRVFKILQHGSTLAGTGFIALAIMQQPQRIQSYFPKYRYYWLIAFFVFLLVILGKYLTGHFISFGEWVVTGISGGLLGILISSIIYYARFPDRRTI